MNGDGYRIEEEPSGRRTLVVTGRWTPAASVALRDGHADGLVLNYAHGMIEPDLACLQDWPLHRLTILSRWITDLAPIRRLAATLEELEVTAAPTAKRVDLGGFTRLRVLAGHWRIIGADLPALPDLRDLYVEGWRAPDLRPLGVHPELTRLRLKGTGTALESVDGLDQTPALTTLLITTAARLTDLTGLTDVPDLVDLWLEVCHRVDTLDDITPLTRLRHLTIADCGRIDSLTPLRGLIALQTLYAWDRTNIADGDLSPLLDLPELREVRFQSRRHYRPPLAEVKQRLVAR